MQPEHEGDEQSVDDNTNVEPQAQDEDKMKPNPVLGSSLTRVMT